MRSLAEIREVPIVVDRDAFVSNTFLRSTDFSVRNFVYQFKFKFLVAFSKPRTRFFVCPCFLQKRHIGFNHSLHVFFYFRKIVWRNWARYLHIVIEFVFYRRTDRKFDSVFTIRKQLLHGVCHNMCSRMAKPL